MEDQEDSTCVYDTINHILEKIDRGRLIQVESDDRNGESNDPVIGFYGGSDSRYLYVVRSKAANAEQLNIERFGPFRRWLYDVVRVAKPDITRIFTFTRDKTYHPRSGQSLPPGSDGGINP